MKRLNRCRRALSFLLSAAMIAGNFSAPLMTFAGNYEELQEFIQETEPEASGTGTDSNETLADTGEDLFEDQGEDIEEQETEETDLQSGIDLDGLFGDQEMEPEVDPEPRDLTDETDYLTVFAENPWYLNETDGYTELSMIGNTLDFSFVPEQETLQGGFSVSFEFREKKGEELVPEAGDVIRVALPWILKDYTIDDCEYVRFIKTDEGRTEQSLDRKESEDTLGFWSTDPENRMLTFTFLEGAKDFDFQDVCIRADLSFDLAEICEQISGSSGNSPEITLSLQKDQTYLLILPERRAEEDLLSNEDGTEASNPNSDGNPEQTENTEETVLETKEDEVPPENEVQPGTSEEEAVPEGSEAGETEEDNTPESEEEEGEDQNPSDDTSDTELTEDKEETEVSDDNAEADPSEGKEETEVSDDTAEADPSGDEGENESLNIEDDTQNAEQEPTGEEMNAPSSDTEPTGNEPIETFTITGQLAFNELVDGENWRSLLRPMVFEEPILLEVTAVGPDGETYTTEIRTQEYAGQDPFYLEMIPDGEGGGSFSIRNVPDAIEVEGVRYTVSSYRVYPDLANLPYYGCDGFAVTEMENTTTISTLVLQVQTQEVTLETTVVGNDDPAVFEMTLTCSNQGGSAETSERVLTQKVHSDQPLLVHIPKGLELTVEQKPDEGYRFSETYEVTEADGNKYTLPDENGISTIQVDQDRTIRTVNFAQNVTHEIKINWIDNNSAARPEMSDQNFVLQVLSDGEWREVSQDDLNLWTGMPEGENYTGVFFDRSREEQGLYAYGGLPGADENGQQLIYRVQEKSENRPDLYEVQDLGIINQASTFTYRESTSFTAVIRWLDNRDAENKRPSREEILSKLRLGRRIGSEDDTSFDPMDIEIQLEEDGQRWVITTSGLPRYRDDNEEYDYYVELSHPIENYATNYNNGTGNYGNETRVCHNGGTINNLITGIEQFSANKIWLDDVEDPQQRPEAVVTLWRYAVNEPGTSYDPGIDASYNSQNAARVVYHYKDEDDTYKDILLSYELPKDNTSYIQFNSQTVTGLPEHYHLPAYDEVGRKYVYFVRETVEGNDYETVYVHEQPEGEKSSHIDQEGAAEDGTIRNVRREKAAVSVDKIWQCPTRLEDLNGVKVELSLWAPDPETKEYKELVVYAPEQDSYEQLTGAAKETALTLEGFTENIAALNSLFYVNICNENGQHYDMSQAVVKEIKITDANGFVQTVHYREEAGKGTFYLNGDQFEAVSAYSRLPEGEQPTLNGVKEFFYTEKNTITGTRPYTLIKKWGSSIKVDEFNKVSAVNFKLKRRSTKDPRKDRSDFVYIGSDAQGHYYETASKQDARIFQVLNEYAQHEKDKDYEFGRIWDDELFGLPKYDPEGYEYQYEGEEVSLMVGGEEKTLSDMGWYCIYSVTDDQTTVTNYKSGGPDNQIDIRKEWNDNGDLENRQAVAVRIYKRADLATALRALDEEKTEIDLDELSGILSYSLTLTKDNGWRARYVSLKAVEKAINPEAVITDENIAALDPADYVILEYRVGSDENSRTVYPVSELKNAAFMTEVTSETKITIGGGFTSTESRDYETEVYTAGRETILNNIRTGKVHVVINKEWKDENNRDRTRPNTIRFRIYQNSMLFDLDPKDLARIELSASVKGSEQTGDPELTLDKWGFLTVTFTDPEKNTGDWRLEVKNLPMFSDEGVPLTYNVEEVGETPYLTRALNDGEEDQDPGDETQPDGDEPFEPQNYVYVSEKGPSTVMATSKEKNYTFNFKNTISGTVSHTAYKRWNDAATEGRHRPDLYITVYQYLVKDLEAQGNGYDLFEDPQRIESLFTDYKDQLWKPSEQVQSSVGRDFDWEISITDLPDYNAEGEKYGYVFKEVMNNSGHTVDGDYVQKQERLVMEDGEVCEFFTNTITDKMKKNGVKTWYGMDEKFKLQKEDYPTPTITLYRTVRPITEADLKADGDASKQISVQTLQDAERNSLVQNGRLEIVNSTRLNPSETNVYTFPDTSGMTAEQLKNAVENNLLVKDGDEYYIPKFDLDGNRYEYYIFESFDDNEIAGQLYTKVASNGNMTNTFKNNVNRRQITVTKDWYNRTKQQLLENEYGKYPSVTFELYRYESTKDPEDAVLIDTVKINASHFGDAESSPGVVASLYSYTFEDLLIYSPKGILYRYYVKEKPINGYETKYEDAHAGTDATIWSDVTTGADLNAPQEENTAEVKLTNKYIYPGCMQISGRKIWDDFQDSGYIYGKRPESIEIELYRYTDNESGQGNKIDKEKVDLIEKPSVDPQETKPYIVWEKGSGADADKWKYVIYNLEQYAPNGMPFIYAVNEKTKAQGYAENTQNIHANASGAGKDENGNNVLKVDDLVNRLNVSYEVCKTWLDGKNRYGFRPSQITVVLERSIDGSSWETIPVGEANQDSDIEGLPSVTKDSENRPIVSVHLTSADVVNNTSGMKWSYKFQNLPAMDKAGNEWKYRCREVEIGSAVVTDNKGGAYTVSYQESPNGTRTDITNTQVDTRLVIMKDWMNDSNNLYSSRPESLSFILQMKGERITDTDKPETQTTELMRQWRPVQGVNGENFTFSITPNDEGLWETTLSDLPTAVMGEDGSYYKLQFRAYEQTEETTEGKQIIGAKNYIDLTDYNNESNDHYIDTTIAQSVSIIHNELIRDPIEINVKKQWYHKEGEHPNAIFELEYAIDDPGKEDWKCFGNRTGENANDHSADYKCLLENCASNPADESCLMEGMKWLNLPKYDLEGNKLVYRVIEFPVDGYVLASEEKTTETVVTQEGKSENVDTYAFTNIQLQDYTVEKIWQNTDYAQTAGGFFTAEFALEQKVGNGDWVRAVDDAGIERTALLKTDTAGDTKTHTWQELPMYTTDGSRISYRAVETKINGINVSENDAYIASYQYENGEQNSAHDQNPEFGGTKTEITNRMVYGFVNLNKAAAYVGPKSEERQGLLTDTSAALSGVSFNILKGEEIWAEGVKTDIDGRLIANADGTYGEGEKTRYLTSGTYTLVEKQTNDGYSKWSRWSVPIEFTVGSSGNENTGEHGTALIETRAEGNHLTFTVNYQAASCSHTAFATACRPAVPDAGKKAYNLESRGVLSFTKKGTDDTIPLNTHESAVYFGVYLEEDCRTQVAGMMPDPNNPVSMILTDKTANTSDAVTLPAVNAADNLPYLRKINGNVTLLSGTYYIKEITPPPGYKLDQNVRVAEIPTVETTIDGETDLTGLYLNNAGTILNPENDWTNEENEVEIFKLDQYGRKVTLKDGEGLKITAPSGTTFRNGASEITLFQNADQPSDMLQNAEKPSDLARDVIRYQEDTESWILTGIFDGDGSKVYTLSEPAEAVPDENLKAAPITFSVSPEGTLILVNGASVSTNVTAADGNDYSNYLNEGGNQLTLRDIARYYHLTITKKDQNGNAIPNIYFKIYKVTGPNSYKALIDTDEYLITDEYGEVNFEYLDFTNQDTGKALKYGLTVGNYYLEELERGAADKYILKSKLEFEIRSEGNEVPGATIISWNQNADTTITNDPVTDRQKELDLEKNDRKSKQPLKDAEYTLYYTSDTHGDEGSDVTETTVCKTDESGELYAVEHTDKNGGVTVFEAGTKKPDISKKGDYVLQETRVPDGYMTPVNPEGDEDLIRFTVSDPDVITVTYAGSGYILDQVVQTTEDHRTSLSLTALNDKTKVYIDKRIDGISGDFLGGAILEIYKVGTGENEDVLVHTIDSTSAETSNLIPEGILKEDTIYRLHEVSAPVGYLEMEEDIFFKLHGTTWRNGERVSKIWIKNKNEFNEVPEEQNETLVVIDETIKAPVNLTKVLKGTTDVALSGVEFDLYKVNGSGENKTRTLLGTAVTDQNGRISWKNTVPEDDLVVKVVKKEGSLEIILRQNEDGYEIQETAVPDHVYLPEKILAFQITDADYKNYRKNSSWFKELTDPGKEKVENQPFETAFELYKFDAENPNITAEKNNFSQIGLAGVKFTLERLLENGSYTKVEGSPYTTEASGLLHIPILQKGTYRLTEETPLTGYSTNPKEMIFTVVNSDYKKTITYDEREGNENHTAYLTDENRNRTNAEAYALENTRNHGSVSFTKIDRDSKQPLNGVQFVLRRTDPSERNDVVDCYFPPNPDLSMTVTTGKSYSYISGAENAEQILITDAADGVLELNDLQWGVYTLTEVQPPNGYIKTPKVLTFTINENGLVQTEDFKDGAETKVGNVRNQVTVQKTDPAGNELTGACFALYRISDDNGQMKASADHASCYSSADATEKECAVFTAGNTTIYGLEWGTYLLREETAPEGYEKTRDILFTMGENGTVSNLGTCSMDPETRVVTVDVNSSGTGTVTVSGEGEEVTNHLAVKNQPIEVKLTKALSGKETVDSGRGEVTYSISGRFSGQTEASTKILTGNVILNDLKAELVAGETYTIWETHAPAGYKAANTVDNPAVISVDEKGMITVNGGADYLSVNHGSDGIEYLTFTDSPIEPELSKKDPSGNVIPEAVLGYAEFSVSGRMVKADGSAIEDSVTVENLTTQNFRSALRGRLIAGEIYEVHETKAPDGYKLAPIFYIRLDDLGRIAERGSSRANLIKVSESETLTVQDDPTAITIRKVDDAGKAVLGAKFELTAFSEIENAVKAFVNIPDSLPEGITEWSASKLAWTSTGDGSLSLEKHLIAGMTYQLTELGGNDRAAGYESIDGVVVFTVTNDPDAKIVLNKDHTTAVIPNYMDLSAASIDASGLVLTLVNPLIRGSAVLTKSGEGLSGTEAKSPLAGVTYELYRTNAEDGTAYAEPQRVYTDQNGLYQQTGGTKGSFTTDANGKIQITGLPEGSYYFIETDAPAAFEIRNNPSSDRVSFEIHNDTLAYAAVTQEDSRVRAKISLHKLTTENGEIVPLTEDAVFKVEYRDPHDTLDTDFKVIGTVTVQNGALLLEEMTYDTAIGSESLRRGTYRFTEIAAESQMLNTTKSARNVFTFEIGNTMDKTYEVNKTLMSEETSSWSGTYISFPENDSGVLDVPIPKKQVTVTKQWAGDENLSETYRPGEVKVQLYRSFNGGERVAVGDPQTLTAAGDWTCTWENLDAYVNAALQDGSPEKQTYLYTYTVEEVDPKPWYTVSQTTYVTQSQGPESGVLDGNTQAEITNTLTGPQNLYITKRLGGGKEAHTFYVRVRLTGSGNLPVNHDGIYMNAYTLYTTGETVVTRSPDQEGYVQIWAGETLWIEVPKGVSYEVEEKTPDTQDGLSYETHYDGLEKGTMETASAQTVITNAVKKHLDLTKTDESNNPLSGAQLKITYVPLAGGRYVGEAWTKIYTTDGNGELKDTAGQSIDLTPQGTYTIRETKAPAGYITPTDNDGNPIEIAKITVSADDIMTIAVSSPLATGGITEDGSSAALTLKNEITKQRVPIVKAIDQANGVKLSGAKLQITRKVEDSDQEVEVVSWTTSEEAFLVPDQALEEGVVYTLKEVDNSAPVGYLETEPFYFILDGTYTTSGGIRYAHIVLTDENGIKKTDQNTSGVTYGQPGVMDGTLGVVDRTIQVPVTLKKVLGDGDSRTAIPGVRFEVRNLDLADAEQVIGTAVTGEDGYLVWADSDKAGQEIVLQQNTNGYQFKEIEAPDYAYNDGRSFTVNPTDNDFRSYLANDALKLNIANGLMETKADGFGEDTRLVINAPYVSTVTLHKYDADEEAQKASVPNTEFTLYRKTDTENKTVYVKAYLTGEQTVHEDGKFITNDQGNLSIVIPEKGTYILEETNPAEGYETRTDNTFTFTLVDDASADFGYNKTTVLQKDNDGVPNTRLMGSMTLQKKDADSDEALNGVVYTLSRDWNPVPDAAYLLKEPMDVTTGKKYTAVRSEDGTWEWNVVDLPDSQPGVLIVEGLNWGFYKIQEKTELSGYVKSDTEYSFTVQANNREHTIHDENAETVLNHKNEICLHKQGSYADADGVQTKNLAGAVFEIHEGSGSSCGDTCTKAEFYASENQVLTTPKITQATSGADGKVRIYGLATNPVGTAKTYHLAEVKAPLGYKLAPAVTFTLDRDGTIRVNDQEEAEVLMSDEPIVLYLEKIDEEASVKFKLSGGEFKLTDACESCNNNHKLANGTEMEEKITTGTDGKVQIPIERVIAGHTYKLEETKAPNGYACTAVVTFSVTTDGKAENVSATDCTASVDAQKGTLVTISNKKIGLTLEKTDYDDPNVKLSGVVFTLKPAEGSAFKEGYQDERLSDGVLTLTTGVNGLTDIPRGLMIHDHSYILTETSIGSNTSYKLPENEKDRSITVKVEKNGFLTVASGNDFFEIVNEAENTHSKLRIKNEKIKLNISKKDQATGDMLSGVKLKLSQLEGGSWKPFLLEDKTGADGSWTTSNEPLLLDSDLIPGTYKLEEMETLTGYNLVTDALIFTVNPSGRITTAKVGENAQDQAVDAAASDLEIGTCRNFRITNPTDGSPGGIGLEVRNAAYTDLKITKMGSDARLLKDVEFRLTKADGTETYANKVTDNDGIAVFEHLPNGEYLLEEVKTAAGYNLLSGEIHISIDRNSETYTVLRAGEETPGTITRTEGTNTITLTVVNQRGLVLPATGTTTPKLPRGVLPITTLMEAMFLYAYHVSGRRRKRR